MTIVHYTNSLSAHQLPLDYELVKLVGAENFRYIYTEEYLQGGAQEVRVEEPWIVREESKSRVEVEEGNPSALRLGLQTSTRSWLENCDLLIVGGIRPIDLMERRLAAGKATFYMAERWFKPFLINVTIPFFNFHSEIQLPGWLRLFHPAYFKMAKRFVKLFKSPHYRFLPIGPWSARDMMLLMRVMGFSRVEVEVCRERFVKWGDFVEPSEKKVGQESRSTAEGAETKLGQESRSTKEGSNLPSHAGEARERGSDFQVASEKDQSSAVPLHLISPPPSPTPLRVLWVGRMLDWKRVDTLIRAVALANERVVVDSRSRRADGSRSDFGWEPCRGGEGGDGRAASMMPPHGDESGARGAHALPMGVDRRAMAEKKVEEWLAGVDEATFEAALVNLVDEKSAAGEYVFANADDRAKAIGWAKRFYLEFSHKLIGLSDGRCVYFVPDVRARDRGVNNSRAWAEYAFHAVSTGGKRVPGKTYFIRHFSDVKCENISRIEATIRRENCIAAIEEGRPERATIHFVGISTRDKRFDIVTRLDEFGNAEANLSEVTVVMTKKKYSEKDPPPVFRPLTEVVEAVVKHQAAGFSPSTTRESIANFADARKGGGEKKIGVENRCTEESNIHSTTTTTNYDSSSPSPPLHGYTLTIVGDGPEKPHLQSLTRSLSASNKNQPSTVDLLSPLTFSFHPSVSLREVRTIMRQHDILVLSSNGYEGWGAVVPEALTEGMTVLGTYEAGASAALLPKENLFHCGDWKALAKMLVYRSYVHSVLPYDYTPKGAAERLLAEYEKVRSEK